MEINLGTLKMPINAATVILSKNPVNIKRGKNNRAAGKAFELKIREDLEKSGWIIMRNSNDVEFEKIDKVVYRNGMEKGLESSWSGIFKQAKPKWVFNPMLKRRVPISSQTGFPDFICIKFVGEYCKGEKMDFKGVPVIQSKGFFNAFEVQYVEGKINGTLSRIERQKIEWIKNNLKIPVFVASKIKIGRKVEVKYERI